MPVLRLFAAAREAAGTASVEVPGETVDEVLDAARARYPDLGAVLDASKVWRNGEPAAGSDRVGTGDEVAVLPPVSGGSGPDHEGRSGRRPTFAPTEPPPPAQPAPAPRRSPSAEAAASRRSEADDRPRRSEGRAPAPAGPPRPTPPGAEVPRVAPAPLEPGVLTRTAAPTGRPLEPEGDGGGTGAATRLTRMRSVGVPVTGSITVRGKERKVSGQRQHRTELGRRYAVVYDTDGPKVTLGVLWAIALVGAVALGWWALTFVIAIAAGWAAMEAADRWRERGVAADPWTAALGAAAVAAAGAAGGTWAGVAILVVVAASVGRMAQASTGRDDVLSAAGNTVGCAIPFGLAAAAVVLVNDLEIGAVVALILFVFAYDAGDFLVGSGSSNSIEGPLTGVVTIAVVAGGIAVLGTPPFEGTPAYTFAAIAAVGCPLGQLAASAILPAADAHAPTVRRLDTLLLLAPIWYVAVDVFMASR